MTIVVAAIFVGLFWKTVTGSLWAGATGALVIVLFVIEMVDVADEEEPE